MSVETSATSAEKETLSVGSLVVTETGDLVILTGDTREYGDVSRGDVAPWYPRRFGAPQRPANAFQ